MHHSLYALTGLRTRQNINNLKRFVLGLLGVGATCIALAQTPADAPALQFEVLEYVVEGNTVLDIETIERAVYPFMGPKRSLADIEAASAALQKAYTERGFGTVTVDIPEQSVSAGVVQLRVVEGRISRTRVVGARYYSQGFILEKVAGAAEGSVPHLPTLQAQLGNVNRTEDRRVEPLLRPGRDAGTTEIDLVVKDQLPLHASLGLNNQASANTTESRLTASLRYDNLWQRDHSLGLQAVLSPQKTSEVQVLSATYTLPQGLLGEDSLVWSYTQSNSEVGAGIGGVTVLGKGRIWGLRRTVSLLLQEREYHLLTLGADYKDFDETISAADNLGETTPIKYMPLNASYLGAWGNDTGRWQWGASLSVGLQGLVNQTAQFRSKRDAAKASYSVVKLDLTREQPLPFWGSSLRARLDAQWTPDALLSNEQFVAGGVDSVRGYLESAVAGDSGLRASLEWRSRNWGPTLDGLGVGRWVSNLSGLAFAEGAAAFVRSPGAGQNSRFGLLGAGVGLRLKAKPGVTGALDLGWALHNQGATRRGDLRLHASGLIEF